MKSASRFSLRATSSPPSVVTSSRFSGTMQTACGRWRSAIACISAVAAISRLSGTDERLHQPVDIGIRDVAAVFAQMRGDPVGPGRFGDFGGAQRVGIGRAARVAHGGDVIDVDAQSQLVPVVPWSRLPWFAAECIRKRTGFQRCDRLAAVCSARRRQALAARSAMRFS